MHGFDADAIRVSAMLFGIGGVEALPIDSRSPESYGAVFREGVCAAASCSRGSWKATTFCSTYRDCCRRSVQIVRQALKKCNCGPIVPVGRMLHETMSKLSDREKNIAAASKN